MRGGLSLIWLVARQRLSARVCDPHVRGGRPAVGILQEHSFALERPENQEFLLPYCHSQIIPDISDLSQV